MTEIFEQIIKDGVTTEIFREVQRSVILTKTAYEDNPEWRKEILDNLRKVVDILDNWV